MIWKFSLEITLTLIEYRILKESNSDGELITGIETIKLQGYDIILCIKLQGDDAIDSCK